MQAPGEDAVFGVRFTDAQAAAHLDGPHDRRQGPRAALGARADPKRGLLVNPNEKFYISIAHTDADVERTLAIVDEAFAAMKR